MEKENYKIQSGVVYRNKNEKKNKKNFHTEVK